MKNRTSTATKLHKDTPKTISKQDIERFSRIQRGKIIIAMNEAQQPLNMRQLSELTGIEIPTMCRRISELQRAGFLQRVFYAPCPTTKYPRVGYYAKKEGGKA